MSKDTDKDEDAGVFVIVAITASAARTGSLETLLLGLPPLADAALVVVFQHMEVFDEDRFRQIAKEAGHDPLWIAEGMLAEPGRLYLNPLDMIAAIEGGHFMLHPAQQAPGSRGTIDSFLVSLAGDLRERAIGIALNGTDGDGTLGARELKAAGGVVLAECIDETLAQSDSAAALADAVLPADQIAARLPSLVEQALRVQDASADSPQRPETREALRTIAGLLRQKTGHDFHGYKPGTFLRRVQRRMQALLIDDLATYVELLRGSADEPQNLFNDLLIGVTEFFRDPKEWEILEHEVIPRLFDGRDARKPIRVWVAGCSTGEEAYSLAILLAEYRNRLEDPPQVQIFASDLDGRALAAGRAGRYPASIAAQLSPERLARWFVKEGDTYCVVKELREMCIFSQHSLIKDAPFSRLDLISCRNLLIYLDADLQEKVIPLFHFALRPGGFLFLGNSENASRHQNLFAPVEARSRIFRRLDTSARIFPDFPLTAPDRRWLPRSSPASLEIQPSAARDLTRWAEHAMERHTPAFVVIDEAYTVLHFSGPTGRYLAPASGAASLNLLQLIHPVLRAELRAGLLRAAGEGRAVEMAGLEIGANGQHLRVDVVVEPRLSVPESPPGFLVIFKDCGTRSDQDIVRDPGLGNQEDQLRRLEDELRLTRDRLQATIEELESTNEELKSSNEEYQSLNEELQSANEELETSKEELQSVNEELTTVNGELAHRVQELGRANSDLKNFLESTQIATLFLDSELRVTNFTPAIVDIFHLIESDEGRPIEHIKARVGYDGLAEDARRVLRTLAPVEREIDNPETQARYIARVLPYRSTDNFIAGVVVTFVYVTARREAEERLRRSEERFRAIVERASDYAIFTTDIAGRIETWPPGAQHVFGWSIDEAVGRPVDITFTPEDRAASVPRQELATARAEGQAADVRWHLRKDGARVFIDGMTRPLLGSDGKISGFLKIGQDVTERRATEAALRASEARQAFLLRLSDALRPLAEPDAIQGEAARILGEHLDVDRAYYVEVDEVAGVARVARDHVRGDVPSLAGEHPVADFAWSVEILRRGDCHVVADTRTSLLVPAAVRSASAARGIIACMGAPLIKEGRLVGALCVTMARAREWTDAEVATLREVGERIWSAVERARAEVALRQSRERFAALTVATSQVVYTMSADWREMRQLAGGGFLSDTLHPNPNWLQDYIHPNDQAETWAVIQRAIATKSVFEHEHRVIRADGRLGWTMSRAVPLLDEAGEIVEWFGAATDVTERRETDARMNAFGEASSDVLWIRDCHTLAFEYVSPAFERVYGMGVHEVMQGDTLQKWLDTIVPEDRDRIREAIEVLRTGERLAFEYRIRRPADGQIRLLRDTGFPIRDPEGQIMWIAGVGHDMTEEAASAERLKVLVAELQHRTRNLLGVVRAVMEQTLTSSASLDDFNRRIGDRLGALARVNGLLSRLNENDRIDFDELIRSELDAHGALDGGDNGPKVRLHGPRGIRLQSSTVQTLALGLHELATNALKYGALSSPEGLLEIRWSLVPGSDGLPRLKIEWLESGVAVAVPESSGTKGEAEGLPTRQGYGRELIEQALPYQLSADVAYDLTPQGVRCTITIPVSTSMDKAQPTARDKHA